MAQIFANDLMNNSSSFHTKVYELTEEDEKTIQPSNIKITLKPHQLTLLKKCIDIENNELKLKSIPELSDDVEDIDKLITRIGVIGDRVGSGKSYVILSLIQMNNILDRDDIIIKSYGLNNVLFSVLQKKSGIHTNLLVIPHNLTNQWKTYIEAFSDNLKYAIINKKTIEDFLEDKVNVEDYNLIVVTSTYYNKFATFFSNKNLKFQRIIYDEVDSLNIPVCRMIDTRFIWFVTASYGNVLYPRGYTKWEPTLNRYVWCANGIVHSGFIKNILLDIWQNVPLKLSKLLIIKNNDEYIENSNHLPEIIKNIIKCRTPNSIRILNGIVDRNIIECLNADDIQGAINNVSSSNKGSEENIIELMIQKYNKAITNFTIKLNYCQHYIYDNENDKQSEIAKITNKIKENETKINLIKQRINESETCSICYEDIENKTITRCCQNSFCFKCINLWLMRSAICPICKSTLDSRNIYSVVNDLTSNIPMEVEEESFDNTICDKHDKYKNLEILLQNKREGAKFLIFSNYDSSFTSIYSIMDKLNIKYVHLKGNANVIKCMVDKYKTGDTDILLVNTRHYGSGLNLENTSDIIMFHKFDTEIEKQVIGRAHRIGRTDPLNIWYFLYENEVNV